MKGFVSYLNIILEEITYIYRSYIWGMYRLTQWSDCDSDHDKESDSDIDYYSEFQW